MRMFREKKLYFLQIFEVARLWASSPLCSSFLTEIEMCGASPPILKHLISLVVSLAHLVSSSVALLAELVSIE